MSGRWRRVARVVPAAVAAVAVLTGATSCPPSAGATAAAVVAAWPQPTVWVDDQSGAAWPVTAAVTGWDAGLTQSIRYGRCRRGSGCVRVVEGPLGRDEIGHTDWAYADSGVLASATVRFNSRYASAADAAERLSTACHELGHALGVAAHSSDPRSCMSVPTGARGEAPATRPAAADFAALNAAAAKAAQS